MVPDEKTAKRKKRSGDEDVDMKYTMIKLNSTKAKIYEEDKSKRGKTKKQYAKEVIDVEQVHKKKKKDKRETVITSVSVGKVEQPKEREKKNKKKEKCLNDGASCGKHNAGVKEKSKKKKKDLADDCTEVEVNEEVEKKSKTRQAKAKVDTGKLKKTDFSNTLAVQDKKKKRGIVDDLHVQIGEEVVIEENITEGVQKRKKKRKNSDVNSSKHGKRTRKTSADSTETGGSQIQDGDKDQKRKRKKRQQEKVVEETEKRKKKRKASEEDDTVSTYEPTEGHGIKKRRRAEVEDPPVSHKVKKRKKEKKPDVEECVQRNNDKNTSAVKKKRKSKKNLGEESCSQPNGNTAGTEFTQEVKTRKKGKLTDVQAKLKEVIKQEDPDEVNESNEVMFLSEKKGNKDEATIDQARRLELQKDIDNCSSSQNSNDLGFGQWSTALFENADRQQKFLRLMGGFKKGIQASPKMGGERSNMALGKEEQEHLQQSLLGEFERAQSRRTDFQNKGAGLGFSGPVKKTFFVDANACHSVRFDD